MVRATLSTPAVGRLVETQVGQGIEAVASELRAARQALPVGRQGVRNFRKWLGWASYRFAAWVNPEIDERW